MSDYRLVSLLRNMLENVGIAMDDIDGLTLTAFLADGRRQRSVAMSLIRIGEAANRVAQKHPDFVDAHPEVRWKTIRGMRNFIAHGYDDLDFVLIWEVLVDDLPPLNIQLAALIAELPPVL